MNGGGEKCSRRKLAGAALAGVAAATLPEGGDGNATPLARDIARRNFYARRSEHLTLRVLAKAIEAGVCLTDLQVPRHSDTQLVYMALAILNKFVPHSLQKPYSNDGHPIRTRLVNTILQKKIEGCHQSEDILQGHYCQAMKTVDLCKIKYLDRMSERIWGHRTAA